MPREAARILLRVTDVKVQRVQDITEEDARKEGCKDREDFHRVWNDCYAKPLRAVREAGGGDGMNRRETTLYLSQMLEKFIDPHNDPRIYWAKEVTFDYSTTNPIRVDYMRFKPLNNSVSGIEKGDFYCYEVKSSVEDFSSKNGHNFIGDLNYYVMIEAVFEAVKYEIPYYAGVLSPGEYGKLKVLKRCHRRDRSRPTSEILLMMWRSSRRDIVNAKRCGAKSKDGD